MMKNTIQPVVFPRNNEELNTLINGMNRAYGKYFGMEVSSSRSQKLRDCICEGIGFTHGAYQQLQAHWESLCEAASCDSRAQIVISTKKSGLLRERIAYLNPALLPEQTWAEFSFAVGSVFGSLLIAAPEMTVLTTAQRTDYPVMLCGQPVGFAETHEDAQLFAGLLIGMMYDHSVPSLSAQLGGQWKADSYIRLRQSSEDLGVCVPFTEAVFTGNAVVLKTPQNEDVTIPYDAEMDVHLFGGLSFDFLIAYNGTAPLRLSRNPNAKHNDGEAYGRVEPMPTHQPGTIEIECQPLDGDIDDAVIEPVSASNPLYVR